MKIKQKNKLYRLYNVHINWKLALIKHNIWVFTYYKLKKCKPSKMTNVTLKYTCDF